MILIGHRRFVLSMAYSLDGSRIVSGSADYTIRVWDAQEGTLVMQPLTGHMSSVSSVAFSPDGTCIVSCSDNKVIWIWDLSDSSTKELQAGSLCLYHLLTIVSHIVISRNR
jgi:WD40 repeat protein